MLDCTPARRLSPAFSFASLDWRIRTSQTRALVTCLNLLSIRNRAKIKAHIDITCTDFMDFKISKHTLHVPRVVAKSYLLYLCDVLNFFHVMNIVCDPSLPCSCCETCHYCLKKFKKKNKDIW